ncbi:MAG: hypothetical protein V3S07_10545, partial [Micropepsaceae bacterium]
MTVNPGFGGQAFLEDQLPKIEAVRERITASGRTIWLEVDGGVNENTAKRVIKAGADTLVAGNAIFRGPGKGPGKEKGGDGADYAGRIASLRG